MDSSQHWPLSCGGVILCQLGAVPIYVVSGRRHWKNVIMSSLVCWQQSRMNWHMVNTE